MVKHICKRNKMQKLLLGFNPEKQTWQGLLLCKGRDCKKKYILELKEVASAELITEIIRNK